MPWKLNLGAGPDGRDGGSQAGDLLTVLAFFLFLLLVENGLVVLWAWATRGGATGTTNGTTLGFFAIYSVAMLSSGATSLAGGLVGFLFGIPRSDDRALRTPAEAPRTGVTTAPVAGATEATGPAVAAPTGSGLRRNTNLETISDGLTKGLLGIGVSQLHKAPETFRSVADAIGPAFGPGTSGKVVGMAVLVYGLGSGFFFGYLATRIYLTGVFARSDPH